MKNAKNPVIETGFAMALLSFAGGFLDAYSYIARGGVLATAQTGNMVFMCIAAASGSFIKACSYLVPIFAFSAGIILVHFAAALFDKKQVRRWRVFALLLKAAIFIAAAFITDNGAANALISFACGIQLSAFRAFNKNAAATTMCTGNLRCAIDAAASYCKTKDKLQLKTAFAYLTAIAAFMAGAVVSAFISPAFGAISVVFAAIPILTVAFLHFIID